MILQIRDHDYLIGPVEHVGLEDLVLAEVAEAETSVQLSLRLSSITTSITTILYTYKRHKTVLQ